jgi:hypothetical protein
VWPCKRRSCQDRARAAASSPICAGPGAAVGTRNFVRTGRPEMLAQIPDDLLERSAWAAEHLAIARSLGLCSYMGRSDCGRRVLGVITFVSSKSERTYSQRVVQLATDLVSCAAVAVQNAALFRAATKPRSAAALPSGRSSTGLHAAFPRRSTRMLESTQTRGKQPARTNIAGQLTRPSGGRRFAIIHRVRASAERCASYVSRVGNDA